MLNTSLLPGKIKHLFFLCFICVYPLSIQCQQIWGRIANPGYENEPIKSTFFFTGNCKNDVQHYEYFPGNNMGLYTVNPVDNQHLRWSEAEEYQTYVVNDLISSGINVVNMSVWGPRGTDNWAWYAPMQTSTYSHDELFDIAIGKDILIAPYLESAPLTTSGSPGYSFMDCFSGDPLNPAPEFVTFMEDLIDRYILAPDNPGWTEKWAQVYDQDGTARYLFCIIHAASTQSGMTDQLFAEGFDRLADTILLRTGVHVGFTLDILPHNIIVPGEFRAVPETTGPLLAQQKSILGIQCYIPEVFLDMSHEDFVTRWKHQFSSRWVHTGIPFIQDISAGYDASIVFEGSVVYGNNPEWRASNGKIVHKLLSQGITFNTWNGYTEGYAGMPTVEFGDGTYLWVNDLFTNYQPETSLHTLPDRIEAEDWIGMSGVQTDVPHDDFQGLYVGWMEEGDWMDYNIYVPESRDKYYLEMRAAKPSTGPQGEAVFSIDDNFIKTVYIPGTGGWQEWETIRSTIALPQGYHKLKLTIASGDWNINWMNIKYDSVAHYHKIPGRIEAEDYYDMSGVISEKCLESKADVNLGYFNNNDWMEYYVDVEHSGSYNLSFRVSQDGGIPLAEGELYIDNTLLYVVRIPPTGGWQDWITLTDQVQLTAGTHKLKLVVTEAPWNINWIEFSLPGSLSKVQEQDSYFSNYPNPFSSETTLKFDLEKAGKVKLTLYNALGKEVKTLLNDQLMPGKYALPWNADGYPVGIYFFKLETKDYVITRKGLMVE